MNKQKKNMKMNKLLHPYICKERKLIYKMAHCNQYFCCLYRTVYNKKRSIYKNQYPLSLVNLIFCSHWKRSKNILFWEEWVGDINFLFFQFFFFFHFWIHPQPHSNLPLSRGGVSGCGTFIVVWGSMAGGGEVGTCGISWERGVFLRVGVVVVGGRGIGGGT